MLNYVTFQITEDDEAQGRDVRWFLRARLGFSRTKVRSLKFDPRGILLDDEPVPNWTRVRAGQELRILLTDSEAREKHILANELPLEILFEDENLLILNKPAGVVCHPAKGHLIDTLSNGVQYYFESQGDFDSRIHLVGRLDKDVSGLVTIAKNAVASEKLQAARTEGRLEKVYVALVRGIPAEDSFELRTVMRESVNEEDFRKAVSAEMTSPGKTVPFAEANGNGTVLAGDVPPASEAADLNGTVSFSAPKTCITRCRVLRRSGRLALLDVCPDTGRLHQIRFSLAEAGFPIIGDTLYGHDPADQTVGRVMLHAETLRFTDPFDGTRREISAPLPESFLPFL